MKFSILSSVSTLALCSALVSLPLHAQEKASNIEAGAIETIVTVVEVDREARVVTVVGPAGGLTSINVPPEAQNLDQVQPGSRFRVVYLASVVVALSTGQPGTSTSSTGRSVTLAPKGDVPGGSVVHTRQIDAVVEKVDQDARTVTVRGMEGGPRELEVDQSVKAFDQVKVGDTVTIQFTEGLAMRMLRE